MANETPETGTTVGCVCIAEGFVTKAEDVVQPADEDPGPEPA